MAENTVVVKGPAAQTFTGNVTAPLVAASGLTGAVTATRYVGGTASLAPGSGTFAAGDWIITADGKLLVCTVGGTSGTWVQANRTSIANLAMGGFLITGLGLAATATGAPSVNQLTSWLTITSGSLPNTGAWASATAKQNPVARDVTVNVEFVTDASNNVATCAIDISSDNSTYTNIGTLSLAAALNTLGAVKFVVPVSLPNTWWIKLTFAFGSVAASKYY